MGAGWGGARVSNFFLTKTPDKKNCFISGGGGGGRWGDTVFFFYK